MVPESPGDGGAAIILNSIPFQKGSSPARVRSVARGKYSQGPIEQKDISDSVDILLTIQNIFEVIL